MKLKLRCKTGTFGIMENENEMIGLSIFTKLIQLNIFVGVRGMLPEGLHIC